MYNIKAFYDDYDDIIEAFGEEEIRSRFRYFITIINDFIANICEEKDVSNQKLAVNDSVLRYCVMDYFSDVYRLKEFHKIGKINDIKRIAYESQWILRRKPIQILSDDYSDEYLVYANEKFVLSYILEQLLSDRKNDNFTGQSAQIYRAFVESLYYHLKYRNCDAKVLELMILSFTAGLNLNLDSNSN